MCERVHEYFGFPLGVRVLAILGKLYTRAEKTTVRKTGEPRGTLRLESLGARLVQGWRLAAFAATAGPRATRPPPAYPSVSLASVARLCANFGRKERERRTPATYPLDVNLFCDFLVDLGISRQTSLGQRLEKEFLSISMPLKLNIYRPRPLVLASVLRNTVHRVLVR